MELTPEQRIVCACDTSVWAILSEIRLQASLFTFLGREDQIEPMHSQARRRCYMKGTQKGVTELETVLRTLHDMIYQRFKRGVLILFPTADNVQDFSKSRFGPIIDANQNSIGKYVKQGGKGTDTAGLKKIGDAFLYLRGATLSQSAGSGQTTDKESAVLRSAPVDCVKFEEMDLFDDDVVAKAKGRMADSNVAEEVYISNPVIPGRGIHKIFLQSDQRHWHRRCGCGQWVSAELTFPDCVKLRPDGTGYIGCPKCGSDVGARSGRQGKWIPACPEKSDYMHGYRMSHLTSCALMNDPAEILKDFQNPPQGNISDVYRLRLGLPHVSVEDQLLHGMVQECMGNDIMPMHDEGPNCMGVDIGKMKHIVIGRRDGANHYQILKAVRVSDWNDIHDLAQKYNVRNGVIDIRPYEDEAHKFQKAEHYRIFLCQYVETVKQEPEFSDVTGIVKAYRTGIMDATHKLFSERRTTLPRMCDEMKIFTEQVCNPAKVLETNKRTGIAVYRYISDDGYDHYRHAMNYFLLATQGTRIVRSGSSGERGSVLEFADNDYDLAAL
jgi:hypothetical protein